MAKMDDVRDELFSVSEVLLRRQLSVTERSALVEAYNATSPSDDIYDRCLDAISEALEIDLRQIRRLTEKTASVDRLRAALNNLKAVAAQAAASK